MVNRSLLLCKTGGELVSNGVLNERLLLLRWAREGKNQLHTPRLGMALSHDRFSPTFLAVKLLENTLL